MISQDDAKTRTSPDVSDTGGGYISAGGTMVPPGSKSRSASGTSLTRAQRRAARRRAARRAQRAGRSISRGHTLSPQRSRSLAASRSSSRIRDGTPPAGISGPVSVSHVIAINRPRIEAPSRPIGTNQYDCIPQNFDLLIAQRQLDEKEDETVLFKFAHSVDMIQEYNIQKKIFFRVCSNIIEMVVLSGVKEWELKVAGYFAHQVVGPLLLNTPTPEDTSKLKHILNITNDTTSKQVFQAMAKHMDETAYPIHFVVSARFNVKYSDLHHKIMSHHTIRRITKAFKPQ